MVPPPESIFGRVAPKARKEPKLSWDSYAKTAEVSTGGEWPEMDDDLYDMIVQDVSEPVTEPNKFKQKDGDPDFVTRFFITWEITSGNAPEGTTLRQYIALPEAYLNEGYLNEKSKLYGVMSALGFDLTGRFKVNPEDWQGMEARGMVEAPRDKDGVQTGWPKITSVKPARAKRAAPAREPVGAAAGARRSRPKPDDDWEED